jgi:hypothetical protein
MTTPDPILAAAERHYEAAPSRRAELVERWELYGAAMKVRVEHHPMSPRRIIQQDIDVVDAVLAVYKGEVR